MDLVGASPEIKGSTTWLPRALIGVAAGMVLLFAAGAKAHSVTVGGFASAGGLAAPHLQALIIGWEFFLGSSLLLRLKPMRLIWLFAICTFAIFAVVALWKLRSGESSCGCFGSAIQVAPLWMLITDLGFVGALVMSWPNDDPGVVQQRRLATNVIVALCGAAVLIVVAPKAVDLREDLPAGSLVVLNPRDWVGKTLPLVQHIESDEFNTSTLTEGPRYLLLFRGDCQHCREVMPTALEWAKRLTPGTVCFLSTAPLDASLVSRDESWVRAHLTAVHQWIVETPTLIVIKEGVVVATFSGTHVERFLAGETPRGKEQS